MGYDAYITRYHRTNKLNTVIVRNDSDINKVVNTVIENQDNFEYEDIDSWCSNGRYWMTLFMIILILLCERRLMQASIFLFVLLPTMRSWLLQLSS